MMKRWQLLILILTLSATSAFADEAEDEAEEEEEAIERVCVNKRSINSFDPIDDQHLYIKATGNKHYLFTMQRRCFDLRGAYGIAVKDTMSRVCSDGFGEIVYRGRGQRLESCRIGTIEEVASKGDARGLVEDRKAEKQEEKADD
ncbi:MAG: DUF6491 family protein [Planctomycetota bacterium]|jgi:hypothetical protein